MNQWKILFMSIALGIAIGIEVYLSDRGIVWAVILGITSTITFALGLFLRQFHFWRKP